MAVTAKLRAERGMEVESMWSDDGFVLRLPDSDASLELEDLILSPAELKELVLRQLGSTSLFAAKFREAASRALLLPKRRPGRRAPLWQQRKRAADLLAVASRYPSFPIILETYRECIRDVFDLPAAANVLRKIQRGEIRLTRVESAKPSPFAAALLFSYIANYIYEGDAPLAERRAQALSIDQSQLEELLGDTDLRGLSERGFRKLRGQRIAMVLQDPKYSLDPVMSVGQQIAETHRSHLRSTNRDARRAALEMLQAVHIRDPERVYAMYPHQVSGGMGQRVMIAMMLIAGPDILIADEPTSALDVTVQTQVLAIMDDLVRSRGMGLILISHNLHLVSSFCDRVLVMYAGQVVETCAAGNLSEAKHPYTRGLLAALPQLGNRRVELPQLQRDPAWMADLA